MDISPSACAVALLRRKRDRPPQPMTKDQQKFFDDALNWECPCGARCQPFSPHWRWNGTAWCHSHSMQVGHVEAQRKTTMKNQDQDLTHPEPGPVPAQCEAAPTQCECRMTEPVEKNLGQLAYEAYCDHTGWKSLVSGCKLPSWDLLGDGIKAAWEVSASRVREYITGSPSVDEKQSEVEYNKQLRKDLDKLLQKLKQMQPSRERSLSITKLQESIMWLGMDLKRMGEANPYPHSYDPSSPVVDKTADGLKL